MTLSRHRRGLRAAATLTLLVALGGVAPLAQAAAPVDKGTFTDVTTQAFEECGLSLVATTTSVVRYQTRPAPGDPNGVAFLLHQQLDYRTVITNEANGKYVVETGHTTFKEQRATNVSGTVYTFRAQQSGVPYVLSTSSGKVLERDRGLVRWEATFDVVGGRHAYSNTGPSADDVIKLAGKHPSWDSDFCVLALPYLT